MFFNDWGFWSIVTFVILIVCLAGAYREYKKHSDASK